MFSFIPAENKCSTKFNPNYKINIYLGGRFGVQTSFKTSDIFSLEDCLLEIDGTGFTLTASIDLLITSFLRKNLKILYYFIKFK